MVYILWRRLKMKDKIRTLGEILDDGGVDGACHQVYVDSKRVQELNPNFRYFVENYNKGKNIMNIDYGDGHIQKVKIFPDHYMDEAIPTDYLSVRELPKLYVPEKKVVRYANDS